MSITAPAEMKKMEDCLSRLFSKANADDLFARELPRPTVKASLNDLDGAILFGAGRFSRALLPVMRRKGLEPAWLVDNNPALSGKKLEGVEIRPASSLHETDDRLVLIMTTHVQTMAQACQHAGVKRWAWFTDIHEVFGKSSIVISAARVLSEPDIDRLCSILEGSEESLRTLKQALACRVTGDPQDLPTCFPGQYFADDIVSNSCYSHFVDCGAYNGDTLREWISRKVRMFLPEQIRYHAFEPDQDNFSLLKKMVAELPEYLSSRITLYASAVGDMPGSVGMIQGGPGTELSEGCDSGMRAQIVRLDDVLANEKIGAIKMDLEGYEPLALKGARGIIEKQRPVLLVSIYHRPEHLWKIPLWINDLGLGYRIFLRHHDTTSSETVCYAVPPFIATEG